MARLSPTISGKRASGESLPPRMSLVSGQWSVASRQLFVVAKPSGEPRTTDHWQLATDHSLLSTFARGEQRRQLIGRQSRLVEEKMAHCVEDEAGDVVAGPAVGEELAADGFETAIAQLRR